MLFFENVIYFYYFSIKKMGKQVKNCFKLCRFGIVS